ncbi:MAG: hypothetical protein ACI8S6_001077 [Myxococcota bacterium]|jgi:hypothetical protein
MYRLATVLLLTACDEPNDTTGECGSDAVFVSGTVTGSGTDDVDLAVIATGDGGEQIEADWYGEQSGAIAYELNLTGGDWSIKATTGSCSGAAQSLSAAACEEHVVDLDLSCR